MRLKHPSKAVSFEDTAEISAILLACGRFGGFGVLQHSVLRLSRGLRKSAEVALAAAPAARALYVFGGNLVGPTGLRTVNRYDPDDNSWQEVGRNTNEKRKIQCDASTRRKMN